MISLRSLVLWEAAQPNVAMALAWSVGHGAAAGDRCMLGVAGGVAARAEVTDVGRLRAVGGWDVA